MKSLIATFRVHQHGAGEKKEGPQAIGRWRGGLTTKIHSAVDALGNPLRSILTAGQDFDPGSRLDGGFGSWHGDCLQGR